MVNVANPYVEEIRSLVKQLDVLGSGKDSETKILRQELEQRLVEVRGNSAGFVKGFIAEKEHIIASSVDKMNDVPILSKLDLDVKQYRKQWRHDYETLKDLAKSARKVYSDIVKMKESMRKEYELCNSRERI